MRVRSIERARLARALCLCGCGPRGAPTGPARGPPPFFVTLFFTLAQQREWAVLDVPLLRARARAVSRWFFPVPLVPARLSPRESPLRHHPCCCVRRRVVALFCMSNPITCACCVLFLFPLVLFCGLTCCLTARWLIWNQNEFQVSTDAHPLHKPTAGEHNAGGNGTQPRPQPHWKENLARHDGDHAHQAVVTALDCLSPAAVQATCTPTRTRTPGTRWGSPRGGHCCSRSST